MSGKSIDIFHFNENVFVTIEIICDKCDTKERHIDYLYLIESIEGHHKNFKQAFNIFGEEFVISLKDKGWTFLDDNPLCPDCSAKNVKNQELDDFVETMKSLGDEERKIVENLINILKEK